MFTNYSTSYRTAVLACTCALFFSSFLVTDVHTCIPTQAVFQSRDASFAITQLMSNACTSCSKTVLYWPNFSQCQSYTLFHKSLEMETKQKKFKNSWCGSIPCMNSEWVVLRCNWHNRWINGKSRSVRKRREHNITHSRWPFWAFLITVIVDRSILSGVRYLWGFIRNKFWLWMFISYN